MAVGIAVTISDSVVSSSTPSILPLQQKTTLSSSSDILSGTINPSYRKLPAKTSGSPEAQSITPEKEHDVTTMGGKNEGGAAAAAAGGESAATGGGEPKGNEVVANSGATGASGGNSALDILAGAVAMKTQQAAADESAAAKEADGSSEKSNGGDKDDVAMEGGEDDVAAEGNKADDNAERVDESAAKADPSAADKLSKEGKAKSPEEDMDVSGGEVGDAKEMTNGNEDKDVVMGEANDAPEVTNDAPEVEKGDGGDEAIKTQEGGNEGGMKKAEPMGESTTSVDADEVKADETEEAKSSKTEAMDESGDVKGEAKTEDGDASGDNTSESNIAAAADDEAKKAADKTEEKNGINTEANKLDEAAAKDGSPKEKVDASAEKEKEAAPAPQPLPLLVGTLAYSDRDNNRRHIIRGNWKYENSHAMPPQRFELVRAIPPDETLDELPKDGEFHGSFNVQHVHKTAKGKIKMKTRVVAESGVKLKFTLKEDAGDQQFEGGTVFDVKGTGTNEYGVFELFGTATKNESDDGQLQEEGDTTLTYSIAVHKKYTALPPAPPPVEGGAEKENKKRKLDEKKKEEEKPPPTQFPDVGICLRGKLVRNTSEELSLDNAAVHRITGLWSIKGLQKILDDPTECQKFEYEHKCSGDSTAFPLSGRYTGFFYVSEGGEKTKISERDVTLKFRLNNAGYHNVEGKGSNIYGKYNISGTFAEEDGTITLFRHFQPIKVKASTSKSKTTHVKISAPPAPKEEEGMPLAAAPPPSTPLTFDDVRVPAESDGPVEPLTPPDHFSAISRGILKIENDGTHTCSGNWAMTNEHFSSGYTSKYHFGLLSQYAIDDAKVMLEHMKSTGQDKDDVRHDENDSGTLKNDGVTPVTLANTTFPIDSTRYKGNFKIKKGATRTQTIVDQQIVLKYVKNTSGSYNVYGKGSNEIGTFDLVGTLILQGKTNGLMQLYRIYPIAPVAVAQQQPTAKKTFKSSLTEKAPTNSGPVPAMRPPERFVPSLSGLQRQSSRMSRLPSRLEEDDPQAQMDRLMDKCKQILEELQESDVQKYFAAPVDPIALNIPTYNTIIEHPMDLGTIKKKMDNNEIDSAEEFARLVRLTFENAVKFNTLPDNIVHISARNLLTIFNKKFGTTDKAYAAARKNKKLTKAERQEMKRKEKEAAKEAKRRAKEDKERKRKAEVEASNESKRMKLDNILAANRATHAAIRRAAPDDPDANMTRPEYNLLVDAIKQVQDQLVGLHKLMKKSNKANAAARAANSDMSSSYVGYAGSETTYQPSTKPKKKKVKREEPEAEEEPEPSPTPVVEEVLEPLSFDEQEALSEAINLLPDRLLPGAMQIIREADFVNDDDDEIDLDIDQLDTKTQRKLQRFVMENVKTKKKKKQQTKKAKQAAAAPEPSPAPSEESTKPAAASSRLPGGKSFFALGEDDDSDDDDKMDEDEDIKADFATNWVANPTTAQDAAAADKSDNMDEEDDLWGAARKEAEASEAQEADRAKREQKLLADAELQSQKRMAEATALGKQFRAKREEEEAAEARGREEQEREAEDARKAAREKALKEVNSVEATVDIGDAQRDLMKQYEQEFNDNYSAGASPSSDFGF